MLVNGGGTAEEELSHLRCGCGGELFRLSLGARGGSFVCVTCREATLIGKLGSEATWTCGCGGVVYAIMLAREEQGRRVRVGLRCDHCGRLGAPAEWPPRAPRMVLRATAFG